MRLRTMWEQELGVALTPMQKNQLQAQAREFKMRVAITQYRSRVMDEDNLSASIKPILDAMRRVGYIHNDSPTWIELMPTVQFPSSRKEAQTVIWIEPFNSVEALQVG